MYNDIQALFIDMDGTLIDTDIANTSAYNHALKIVVGKEINLGAENFFRITSSAIKKCFPNLPDQVYQQIKSIKNESYESYLPLTKVNQEVLSHIKANSDKIIVLVSKANHTRVIATLTHHNLLDYFDFFYCNESKMKDKTYNKYLDALNGLGISANNVMVFENEDEEIANALSAGISVTNITKIGV